MERMICSQLLRQKSLIILTILSMFATTLLSIGIGHADEIGFTGSYYNGINFDEFVFTRIDPKIDFWWDNGSPHELVGGDTFSIEWAGIVNIPFDAVVPFYIQSDEGVRLYIDGELIIDQWNDQPPTWSEGEKYLYAGPHNIRLQYYKNAGGAMVKFCWYNKRTLVPDIPDNFDAKVAKVPERLQCIMPGDVLEDCIVIQNTGIKGWKPGEVFLKISNETLSQEVEQIGLSKEVSPENYYTFNFNITAPLEEGVYRFRWQMHKEGLGLFGQEYRFDIQVLNWSSLKELSLIEAGFEDNSLLEIDPPISYVCNGGPLNYGDGVCGESAVIAPRRMLEYIFSEILMAPEGTVMFWCKLQEYEGDGHNFLKFGSDYSNYFQISIDGINGYMRFVMSRNVADQGVGAFVKLSSDQWFHIAAVWKNGDMRLYLNGWQVGPRAEVCINNFFIENIIIGSLNNGKLFYIDNLKIINSALNDIGINAEYLSNLKYNVERGIQIGPLPQIAVGNTYPLRSNIYCDSTGGWIDIAPIATWVISDGDANCIKIDGPTITGVDSGICFLVAELDVNGTVVRSPPVEVKIRTTEKALVLLDQELYPLIEPELCQYKEDVETNVPVEILIEAVAGLNNMDCAGVRRIIRGVYLQEGIIGVLLIGHVPYATWGDGWLEQGGAIDAYYYRDLDGTFVDANGNGTNDELISIGDGIFCGPEIWCSFIYPNIDISAQMSEKVEVIKSFFQKTHRYYLGKYDIKKKAVMYYDGDNGWYHFNLSMESLCPKDDRYCLYLLEDGIEHYGKDVDENGKTISTSPLPRYLSEPPDFPRGVDYGTYEEIWNSEKFELCSIMTHANPWSEYFSGDNHFMASDEIKSFQQGAVIVCVLGCSFHLMNIDPKNSGFLAYPFGESCNQVILSHGLYVLDLKELSEGGYFAKAHLRHEQAKVQNGGNSPAMAGNPFITVVESRRPKNQPPEIAPIGDQQIEVGKELIFTVNATDSNGTIPSLSTGGLPSGAVFIDGTDGTGTFSWIPSADQIGTHTVNLTASDGMLTASEMIIITVIQEPVSKGQEPESKGQEPESKGQEPESKEQEPESKGQEPEPGQEPEEDIPPLQESPSATTINKENMGGRSYSPIIVILKKEGNEKDRGKGTSIVSNLNTPQVTTVRKVAEVRTTIGKYNLIAEGKIEEPIGVMESPKGKELTHGPSKNVEICPSQKQLSITEVPNPCIMTIETSRFSYANIKSLLEYIATPIKWVIDFIIHLIKEKIQLVEK